MQDSLCQTQEAKTFKSYIPYHVSQRAFVRRMNQTTRPTGNIDPLYLEVIVQHNQVGTLAHAQLAPGRLGPCNARA